MFDVYIILKENEMKDKLIKIREAAEMLSVHTNTLREWDKAGKLKAVKTPGGQRRYLLSNIIKIMQGKYDYDKENSEG